MSNVNRLDAAWASMTTGDRIVILGHDRPYLDDTDKARLAAVIEAKANRNKPDSTKATPHGRVHRTARGTRDNTTRRTPTPA